MTVLLDTRHAAGLQEPKTLKLVNGHGGDFQQTALQNGSAHESQSSSQRPRLQAERPDTAADTQAVLTLRNLIFDICNHNGGGHGGSALGMAAIGVALYKYVIRYNPSDPSWFDRDRFVLSNGHCAMFLYALNHLTGFEDWTIEELKGYGSAKINGFTTLCHAHPEIEVPGVEVTTGPLGQGIANAVGLAIASKNLAARYNKPSFKVVQSRVWCMTGDGCLMEGVALESIALAGHLQLDNLVLIYDNNQVTCDGPLEWINTEDINEKMRATGWHVLEIADGSHDVGAIVAALEYAQTLIHKPVFINIKTVIGIGTQFAGTAKAHHGQFDLGSVRRSKELAGHDPDGSHQIPTKDLSYFRERKSYGQRLQNDWNDLVERYTELFPEIAADFSDRISGNLGTEYSKILNNLDTQSLKGLATREVNGVLIEKVWPACKALCGGGADLVNSNKVHYSETDVFHPLQSYTGRYLRYGIREHAMASISNGIAAYNPGTFLPITATFFMFYIYAAPGVRMGALSNLQVMHFATHDSFAEGQNGPTHQPVELDSLYRAMPNLQYIRPCDAEEVVGAWLIALQSRHQPSMISLGRDPVGNVANTDRHKVARGAYVVVERPRAQITLASCGTNLHYVVQAAEELSSSGLPTRVVSAPCFDLFDRQEQAYQASVFPKDTSAIISVEEYVATTWARYTTASIGMTGYGYSASNLSNYERFGLEKTGIVRRTKAYLESIKGTIPRMAGWRQI